MYKSSVSSFPSYSLKGESGSFTISIVITTLLLIYNAKCILLTISIVSKSTQEWHPKQPRPGLQSLMENISPR